MKKHFLITHCLTISLICAFILSSAANAAELNMAQILQESAQIISEKKAIEAQFEEHKLILNDIKMEGQEFDRRMTAHNNEVLNFNARCQRTFYKGEEAAYASCQQGQARLNSNLARLNQQKEAILQRKQGWDSKAKRLDRQYGRVKERFTAWERQLKITKFTEPMQSCLNRSSKGTMDEIVNSYQQCWDSAKEAERLKLKPSTRFLGIQANPEQYTHDPNLEFDTTGIITEPLDALVVDGRHQAKDIEVPKDMKSDEKIIYLMKKRDETNEEIAKYEKELNKTKNDKQVNKVEIVELREKVDKAQQKMLFYSYSLKDRIRQLNAARENQLPE